MAVNGSFFERASEIADSSCSSRFAMIELASQFLSSYVRQKDPAAAIEELKRVVVDGDFAVLRQLKESFCGDF